MEPALTLANIPLDLQITICIFLHPSHILALRRACKALELATRQRMVWVAALQRVCLDNALFLPSFPIPDMNDLELERAAMAPRRWIDLCTSRAFRKQRSNDFTKMLHTRTRIIKETVNSLFIVPGGRYMVTSGKDLSLWDLGYVSTVECKLVASFGQEGHFSLREVQPTADGKGLVILSHYGSHGSDDDRHLSIFEVYPQSEIPLITLIANVQYASDEEYPLHLLSDTLISCSNVRVLSEDRIIFRIWNYRTNCATCFSVSVDLGPIHTFATKTAIIIFCNGISIWAIPPLSPQPSDLRHFVNNNSTHIPPVLKIPIPSPDDIVRHTHENFTWWTVSTWYATSWEGSIYFDMIYTHAQIRRFKINIKPDLSDASLHAVNMSAIISKDLKKSLDEGEVRGGYKICEDALVCVWNNRKTWGAYAGLTSAPFTDVVTRWNGPIDSLCPASGRFVYRTDSTDDSDGSISERIVVVYLF